MSNLVVIQQPFGLGDCIFAASIAHDFLKEGKKVIWPVLPHLVEGLNRAYPRVVYVDHTKFNINYENKSYKEIEGMIHLPMRYSEHLMGRPYKLHMISKYEYLGKKWHEWKRSRPQRDFEKERKLCYDVLGIKLGERFNFISNDFGNAGKKISIQIDNGLRNVHLKKVEGYSLFDWILVMQLAENIHAVSSSSLYLFELFDLTAREIHLYPRKPVEQDFQFVEFVFTKPYILHE